MAVNNIDEAAKRLWKSNKKEDWDRFKLILNKSKAKYYKVFFEKGKLAKAQDLRKSYAELYDANYAPIAKVPIFMTLEKGGIEGATIYLKGLLNTNK